MLGMEYNSVGGPRRSSEVPTAHPTVTAKGSPRGHGRLMGSLRPSRGLPGARRAEAGPPQPGPAAPILVPCHAPSPHPHPHLTLGSLSFRSSGATTCG